MKTNIRNRVVTFRYEDGCLVRTVAGPDGRSYIHRCALKVYEIVAHALDETPSEGEGITLPQIVARENLPHTQVDVALAFLCERGIIDRRHRRSYPLAADVYLDAMIEWHALREAPAAAE